MQNTKGTQSSNQPQQNNQSNVGEQCHDVSAQVAGKSYDVNDNDERDQNQPATETVTSRQQPHQGSADVEGNSLHVNENDVRDHSRPGTQAARNEEQSRADRKK
jgi:hypothetical protein